MKFLTNALSAMSVNVQEEINNSINILLDPKKEVKDHINALDVLVEYVDNIDFANGIVHLVHFFVNINVYLIINLFIQIFRNLVDFKS